MLKPFPLNHRAGGGHYGANHNGRTFEIERSHGGERVWRVFECLPDGLDHLGAYPTLHRAVEAIEHEL